jgi:hypothetical protein
MPQRSNLAPRRASDSLATLASRTILPAFIHNADACFLDRDIQSSNIVHAALLLPMLEAADADLVSPSA